MNVRRAFVVALAVAAMAGWAGGAAAAMSPEERRALTSAERWLVPVDAGHSANAYAMTAADFKATVTREQGRDGMRDLRKPYGRVVLRQAEKLAFATPDPRGGPGEKIVILFATKFVANKTAEEEVTLVRESDGLWRVTGYFIR